MKLPLLVGRPAASSLPLQRSEVMRFLGYKPGKTLLTPAVEALVDRGIDLALQAATPTFTVGYCAIGAVTTGNVALTVPSLTWKSVGLARLLRRGEAVTLVAATIGSGIEDKVQALFTEQDYATATVVDAAGSALIQALGLHVQDLVAEQAAGRSLKATPLFCPGYADWDIYDMPFLADQAGGSSIGIRCNSNCYLYPQKSLVGLIGWVAEEGRAPASGCDACSLKTCQYRKVNAK